MAVFRVLCGLGPALRSRPVKGRAAAAADREITAAIEGAKNSVRIAFVGLRNIGPAAAGGIESDR